MYRELNDYEILYMVSESREDTFNVLYKKYQPLIYKMVKEYSNFFKRFGYEIEDLMQIGYLTLYKSSSLYNIYNDSMFYTYFKSALFKAIITEIKRNSTLKREVLNKAFSYDTLIPNTELSYLDTLPDNKNTYENFEDKLVVFKNSMPYDMSNVFEMYYNGYNKNEISILLGKEINIVKEFLRKIKKHALTYKCFFFK